MNAGFVARSLIEDFGSLLAWSTPITRDSWARNARITRETAQILHRVPTEHVRAVIGFMNQYPAAVSQLSALEEATHEVARGHDYSIGEIVLSTNLDDAPELDVYIRVTADRATFRELKRKIRDRYTRKISFEERYVAPVILRRTSVDV